MKNLSAAILSLSLVFGGFLNLKAQDYNGPEEDIELILENIKAFSKNVMASDAEGIGQAYSLDAKIFPNNVDIIMLPLTIPLILSLLVIIRALDNPDGAIAFWMSQIPLTSPLVMMARIPFEVPLWEQLLSMDGLEWRRSKYSRRVQNFLKYAEAWAAKRSDLLIADSKVIQEYLESKYPSDTVFIPYGANQFKSGDPSILESYGLEKGQYNLLVARLEPENNIETILQGVLQSESQKIMLVVGNHDTPYGEYLKGKFKDARIRFVRGTYKKEKINNLRYYCNWYFHGFHSGACVATQFLTAH